MKLIDILVESGFEWDVDYEYLAQDEDGEVWSYSHPPLMKDTTIGVWDRIGGCIVENLGEFELAEDWSTTVITREEYMKALKDNQEWVKITKEQIKDIPVGSDIRINGKATKLKSHYGEDDYGFKCEDPLVGTFCDVFPDADWAGGSIVEVKSQLAEQQKPKGHPHAAIIGEYAEVALTSEEPWLEFEYKERDELGWQDCVANPLFSKTTQYRRKQRTIRIGEYDVPEPVREPLEDGQVYFAVAWETDSASDLEWCGDSVDLGLLKQGRIHLTKEAADLHTKALLSFTSKSINK